MRLLLDRHLLLRAAADSARLPPEARKLLEDDKNDVYYSAASIWEIAIKSSLRRDDFCVDLTPLMDALPEMGLIELPIAAAHADRVVELPFIHRDLLDRLLIGAEHCGAAYTPDQRSFT